VEANSRTQAERRLLIFRPFRHCSDGANRSDTDQSSATKPTLVAAEENSNTTSAAFGNIPCQGFASLATLKVGHSTFQTKHPLFESPRPETAAPSSRINHSRRNRVRIKSILIFSDKRTCDVFWKRNQRRFINHHSRPKAFTNRHPVSNCQLLSRPRPNQILCWSDDNHTIVCPKSDPRRFGNPKAVRRSSFKTESLHEPPPSVKLPPSSRS
jgi:hypothetical protein